MAQPPASNGNDIIAHITMRKMRLARPVSSRGGADAAAIVSADGKKRFVDGFPGFDFGKNEEAPAFGDKIDFSDWRFVTLRQD